MKSGLRLTLLSLVSVICMSSVYAGNSVGNGGDMVSEEFIFTGRQLVDFLTKMPAASAQLDAAALATLVENTNVASEDELFLNGVEVSAINYPDLRLIKVSRARWGTVRETSTSLTRFTFVLHEYLGIAGIDDTNYRVSQEVLKNLKAGDFSLPNWWNPMNPVNRIEFTVMTPQGSCGASMSNTQRFELEKREETVSTHLNCHGVKRTVTTIKKSMDISGFNGINGLSHSFQVQVLDENSRLMGEIKYVPDWGQCLIPDILAFPNNLSCSQSGWMFINDVMFKFSYSGN